MYIHTAGCGDGTSNADPCGRIGGRLGQNHAAAPPPLGTFRRVRYEAGEILRDLAAVRRWRQAGALLANDVTIFYPGPGLGPRHPCTQGPPAGSQNRFRRGPLQNSDKCNVFALDLAWRSGFRVPMINIHTAANPCYSYPLANTLTSYAEGAFRSGEGDLTGSNNTVWGWLDTSFEAAAINRWIEAGSLEVLVGWRRRGTGHVGIISRIRAIATDGSGRITSVTYDGWEATTNQGAVAVTNRNWRTTNCGPLTGQCPANPAGNALHVFCAIHIIGLVPEREAASRGVVTRIVNRCRLVA
jgi:hypothetical protein